METSVSRSGGVTEVTQVTDTTPELNIGDVGAQTVRSSTTGAKK